MSYEELQELSQNFITLKYQQYRRYFIRNTPMKHRFSIILGERGIGKTTSVIQSLVDFVNGDFVSDEILYIQADHFLVRGMSLYEIAEKFTRLGGKVIAFDEIHKYPDWSIELKSIYDTFPDLRIIVSGSSALEIHKGTHDLSRRAIVYRMFGMSFREFIELKYGLTLPTYTLEQIISNHSKITFSTVKIIEDQKLKILKLFKEYLEYGYYPYFLAFESVEEFKMTVEQNLHTTLESDLSAIYLHLTGNSIKKIKQLVGYLTQAVPFTPNWQQIKKITEIGDDRTLKTYFKYLEDASIIAILESASEKMKRIESPEKILPSNPNQLFAFGSRHPNVGTLRETFFLCNVRPFHKIAAAKNGDFCVDQTYYFEVEGKNKKTDQIKNFENSFLAVDEIEQGSKGRIPLWLFGFVY